MKIKNFFFMNIASHSGIMFLLVFSLSVMWVVISVGERIIENAPDSKIVDSQKEMQKIIQEK